MKNLLLILLASFSLLFVMGQFGQVPESGQASGSSDDGGVVEGFVHEAQAMINKAKQASTSHQIASADGGNKASAVPHEGQVETAAEESAQDEPARESKPTAPIVAPSVWPEQGTSLAGDVPTPALGDGLRGPGAVPDDQDQLFQNEPAEPAVHRDRHTIEEVIALSRNNASRFRRIHTLISGD